MDQKQFQELLKNGLDDMKNDLKTDVEKTIDSKMDERLKDVDERLEKMEKMPLDKKGVNFSTRATKHRGYNLAKQGREVRNKVATIEKKNPGTFDALQDGEKFEDLSKFVIDLVAAKRHQDPEAQKGIREFQQKAQMQEGTDSEGGYLVPDEYQMDLLKLNREKAFAMQNCSVIPMSGDTKKVPKEASMVSVSWTAEETAATETEPTFGMTTLTAKKLDGYGKVTNELLEDTAIDIVSLLLDQFSNAINLELDNQVLNGTGDPVSGVLTATAGASVTTSGDAFSTISASDLSELDESVSDGYLTDGGMYVFNKKVKHYIRTLTDDNGQFVYQRPGGGDPGTIWEYPFFVSSKAPSSTAADTAFVVFGNFKYFYIGVRKGSLSIDIDPYSLFTSNATQFRVVNRFALAPGMGNAFARLLTAS